ncbi:MAG: D-cysteine desulfhydrase family protein [Cyanobacteria bacterium P01_E01_bin.48]
MPYRQLPRRPLGFFPTPLHALPHLSDRLGGPRLFIKRDDQTGLALGGNKTRKLEYLIADAIADKADTLVTAGATQSNHCRQTAAAAVACGLSCDLVLGGSAPTAATGNYLLDCLFNARVHWAGDNRKGETIPEIANELRERGRIPYVIPYGGSNAIGASAFVTAFAELTRQLQDLKISHIILASSSGGTQAGLTLGKYLCNSPVEIIGIEIDKGEAGSGSFAGHIATLATQTANLLEVNATFSLADVALQQNYVGEGYGMVGELERRAIALTAQTEGILLDPVYTGRAMGALMDLCDRGQLTADHTVLFWHTGGTPALFAHSHELMEQ